MWASVTSAFEYQPSPVCRKGDRDARRVALFLRLGSFPSSFPGFQDAVFRLLMYSLALLQKYLVNSPDPNVTTVGLLIWELVQLWGHRKSQFLSAVLSCLGDMVLLPTLSHQMLHYPLCWQAAYSLHQSVRRCAMLWKQKALSKKLSKPGSFLPPLEKQVTFKMPGVSPETRGHSAEEEPWPSQCSHLPCRLADGNSVPRDLWVWSSSSSCVSLVYMWSACLSRFCIARLSHRWLLVPCSFPNSLSDPAWCGWRCRVVAEL